MVTKPQTTGVPPVPFTDDYVCPDPEPRDMIQSPTINKSGYFLARHFAARPDTLVRAPCVLNFDPSNMNHRVEPDLLVAFDVEAASILPRNGYIIWEVGKPPDYVMEVASETTHHRDTGFKSDLYARLGIAEYWRVDPTGGDFYGYALAGDRLVDGEYQAVALQTEVDGTIWGYSETLDLSPCWHPAWDWGVDDETNLRFYDRKTGRYLCDFLLVEEALATSEAAREEAEARLAAEQATRVAAEERICQLEAQLNREQS